VNGSLNFSAVWAHKNNSPNFGYIGQLWEYLQINKTELKESIIIGNFKSNKIWDQWDRWWNHTDVVKELYDLGLQSLYHINHNEQQGKESKPTFFHQRKLNKPYYIDYCFAPNIIVNKLLKFNLGDTLEWIEFSDHIPLILVFE
jgi:hypothetical protein